MLYVSLVSIYLSAGITVARRIVSTRQSPTGPNFSQIRDNVGEPCDSSAFAQVSGTCGYHDVQFDVGNGIETYTVSLGCYESRFRMNGSRADSGTDGVCYIPRLKYCSEDRDDECRWGSSCRVSHRSGYTTCQTGSVAGTTCRGDGSKHGDCADYNWVVVKEGSPEVWSYARLYCIDVASVDLKNYRYAKQGETGVCKSWQDAVCAEDEDCMFGLYCVTGTCRYDDARSHVPRHAELVVRAARKFQREQYVKLSHQLDVADSSGAEYAVMSPFALAFKSLEANNASGLQAMREHLDTLYESLQNGFVSIAPAKVGGASRSGSKLYTSNDRRWILKQVRKNEFSMLVGSVASAIKEKFRKRQWTLDSPAGVQGGSLINLPVLTMSPGNWIVLRNVSDFHHHILQQNENREFQVLQKFDVKPPPARSDGREQFLASLLTLNNGNGLFPGEMANFRDNVQRKLQADLLMLGQLHLVDYSFLIEMYDLGSGSVHDSQLGHSCIADPICREPDHERCIVLCFSIIDWLRPFLPGRQYKVQLENRVKGNKFSDYAGKTRLFLQCIATFGSASDTLSPTELHDSSALVPRSGRVASVADDACSNRWSLEHGVEMNLLASACQPFVKAHVAWSSAKGVSDNCEIGFTDTSSHGACENREHCREGKSCTFMVWGSSYGCYPIPFSGSPSMHTIVSRCAVYVSELCEEKFSDAIEAHHKHQVALDIIRQFE